MSDQLMNVLGAADAAQRRGQTAEARRLFDQAVALAPADPRVRNARGMAALAARDHAIAAQDFAAAAAAAPREKVLWMNLAIAQRGLDDAAGEQASLEQVLAMDRRDFMANLRLAELHDRHGRGPTAATHWAGVVQLATAMDDRPPLVEDALARGRAFLLAHNEARGAELEALLGADIAALGPEGRRIRACLDHSLGRRPLYHNHCHGLHYPFLPADEYFDRAHFPWLEQVEARTDAIRAEGLALLAAGGDAIRPYVQMDAGTPDNKWSELDHSLDWSAAFLWEYGVRNDAVCALCPETAAALELVPQNIVPGKAPTAFFSILKAGAHIPPHTGVTNTRTIIHLPLVVPPGTDGNACRFRVGGETRAWREGEAFGFDDTIEHEAWNDSDRPRMVLIFDVWNPYLSEAEQGLVARLLEAGGVAG